VLNPFDQDTLDMIQKTIQTSDMGFQVTKVDKTILVTQPPNSMK
jgi:ribosome recycling factor